MASMTGHETVGGEARKAGWGGPVLMIFVRLPLILVGYLAFFGFFVLAGSGSPWSRTLGYANFFVSITADAVCLVLLAWLLRREGKRLRDLIEFRRGSLVRDVFIGVGLFVLLGVAFFAASTLGALFVYGPAAFDPNTAQGQTFSYDPPLWVLWWATLVLPLSVAFAEEMTYRAYALPRLVALTGKPWIGIVIMSLGFGLQHAVLPLIDWRTSLSRVLAMFLVGIVFGVLYLKLKRLVPLIVGHWALDFLFLGLFPLLTVLATR